ncbi:SAM-dependent methyltransferase [Sphingomonas sp. SUN039]|nr:SAM-dependent methyltransferase [Sphingomonas sp. SUN039]UVO55907.1 SAM-dependent methyltransferase [Sphingomonas sp. SUN039]
MAAANAEYYAKARAIGAAGDFITAPEISQMFGEMIGAWIADLWGRAGRPAVHYVELGPGRGTLAADALRTMAKASLTPTVHFVETSPRLRAEQAARVPGAIWHDDVSTLPDDAPLVVVANEFFDALPIEQIVRGQGGWHRRLVACQDTLFLPIAGPVMPEAIVPEHLRDAPVGSLIESSPASVGVVRELAARLARQGGAALIVDYGYDGPALGETLQAVRGHGFANPFDAPGEVDLSAHVDFAVLGAAGQVAGATVHGPVPQRDFLGQLGIATRAAALAKASPPRADEIGSAHARLTGADAMGTLFRAMALTGSGWPQPAGFA